MMNWDSRDFTHWFTSPDNPAQAIAFCGYDCEKCRTVHRKKDTPHTVYPWGAVIMTEMKRIEGTELPEAGCPNKNSI